MPIIPERLRSGDTVALVAPASPPPDPALIDLAIGALEKPGFRVKPGRHLRARRGYLAGDDRERAGDLMRAFTDEQVRAIFCIRGGYGSSRLLPVLDYKAIRRHPKILVGYSDITSLHCALLTKSNLVSFHGPMVVSDLLHPECAPATRDCLLRTLMEPAAPGAISQGFPKRDVSVLRRGTARGRLIGGNLAVLCASIGTPYQPAFAGRILFLEDVSERLYRADRMLTHLLNAGLLQQVAGVAVGLNLGSEDAPAQLGAEYKQTIADMLRDRLLPLRVPVVTGLPFGHGTSNATLPIGVEALLDGRRGELVITKPAVK
jgi:muramoyltetrapeptide carboxypeptidase